MCWSTILSNPVIQHSDQHSRNCWKGLEIYRDNLPFNSRQPVPQLEMAPRRNCKPNSLCYGFHVQYCHLWLFFTNICTQYWPACGDHRLIALISPCRFGTSKLKVKSLLTTRPDEEGKQKEKEWLSSMWATKSWWRYGLVVWCLFIYLTS